MAVDAAPRARVPDFRARIASWPVLVTLALYLATLAWMIRGMRHLTQGAWVYPLDDTYIHMAIAKSFATHGVWGVTPYAYTSSSSAPLWSLLIAIGFKLFGVNVLVPFVLALLFAVALIVVLGRVAASDGAPPGWVLLVLLASVFAAPLPALTFSGMEHVMHTLVTLLVLGIGVRLLGPDPRRRDPIWFAVACAVLVMARYEGMFLIFALGLLLVLRGRWTPALLGAAGAAVPIVIYGAISHAHGWFWLPNSVLLKGHALHGSLRTVIKGIVNNGYRVTWANPHVLVVMLAVLALLLVPRRSAAGRANRDALTAFGIALLLHMQFAGVGWFYRYEAYLVCIGIVLVGSGLWIERDRMRWFSEPPRFLRLAAAFVLLVLVARPLGERAVRSVEEAPRAAANIYGQQIQTAKFLHRYYSGQPVMVNDVGAVAFFGDEHVLDIWGLGTLESAHMSLEHHWTTAAAQDLVARSGARVGVIYEEWFRQFGGTPANWTLLGCWKIPKNVTCAFDSVAIYSLTPGESEPLKRHLREFDAELPPDVMRFGAYREPPALDPPAVPAARRAR